MWWPSQPRARHHHVAAAVELGLGNLDRSPQAGQVADVGDGVVEGVVLGDGLGEVPPLHRALMAGEDLMQEVGVLLAHVGGGLGRTFHLEGAADEEGLLDLAAVHGGRARGKRKQRSNSTARSSVG